MQIQNMTQTSNNYVKQHKYVSNPILLTIVFADDFDDLVQPY